MATGTAGVATRQDPRQVVNTLKKTVNFNDTGIATGVAFDNYIPQGAFIENVLVEITTAFNAATTNVLTVGTVAAAYNNIVAAGDVTPTVLGVYQATRGFGRGLTAAGDVLPVAKYTQTGAAATTGVAVIVIFYEGGWRT